MQRVAASELVAVGEAADGDERPLRLVGTWLYLDRYWAEERAVADELLAMSEAVAPDVAADELAAGAGKLREPA